MKTIVCFLLCLLLTSCTMRVYDINYNYYVGNNINAEKTSVIETTTVPAFQIPQGSGNLTVYVQAEVPKNINASAELDVPLIGR